MPVVRFRRAVDPGVVADAYAVTDSNRYLHELLFENNRDEIDLPVGRARLIAQLAGVGGSSVSITVQSGGGPRVITISIPPGRTTRIGGANFDVV